MLLDVVAGGSTGPVGSVRAAAPPSPILSIGFLQTIDSLNPYRGINDPSYLLYGLIYDYPFAFDQDGKTIPNLITHASCANPQCTVWNFTVRQGVFWSDGSPMTVADVNFTWNYDSQNLFHLWAFEPYFNQVVQCNPPKFVTRCGAAITGQNNVTVYFNHPFVSGEDLYAPIVQRAQWSGVSAAAAETSYANKNPIGTGPFIADPNIYNEFLNMPLQPIHLYKNPRYHPLVGNTVPSVNITDIYLWVYTDPTTLVQALNAGTIQLAQMPPSSLSAVTGPTTNQVALEAIQEWNEIGITQINSTKLNPIRYDTAVRQALAHATNKDYIIQQYYDGLGRRGDSLISPIVPWWYDPVAGGDNLTFNVPLANQILNATGYDTWSGGTFGSGVREATSAKTVSYQPPCYQCLNPPNATVTIPAGEQLVFTLAIRPVAEFPEEYHTAQYLQQQWAQIGVRIDIKPETTEAALSTDVYNGNVEMYIWYWSSDQDPNYMLSMESSWTLDGWSDNYWNNGTYNQLYIKQMGDLDYNTRLADVKQAQKVQYESATYIIYIYPYGVWSMRYDVWSGWGNWNDHPYRQMNAYWGANPLWFDLYCQNCTTVITNSPPSAPVIQTTSPYLTAYVNQTRTFSATSSDAETYDTLNWTWYWGDGRNNSWNNNTAVTATVTSSHSWNRTGNFTVTVTVSDGVNPPVPTAGPVYVNVIPVPTNPGSVQGNVTDPGGTGIVGAQVLASPGGVFESTGTGGAYTMSIAAGTYTLTASANLFSTNSTSNVVVTAGQTTYENFVLVPNAGWVTGNVTSSTDGAAIIGAIVKVTASTGEEKQTSTIAGGVFNVTVEPGTFTVNVTANGYYGKTVTGVQVVSGAATALAVKLNPIPQSAPGFEPLVIAAIAAVVIIAVIAVLAVFLTRRRRSKEKEEGKIEFPPKT